MGHQSNPYSANSAADRSSATLNSGINRIGAVESYSLPGEIKAMCNMLASFEDPTKGLFYINEIDENVLISLYEQNLLIPLDEITKSYTAFWLPIASESFPLSNVAAFLAWRALDARDFLDQQVGRPKAESSGLQQFKNNWDGALVLSSHKEPDEMLSELMEAISRDNSRVIGVSGGSGQGKDTFVEKAVRSEGMEKYFMISLGDYFRTLTSRVLLEAVIDSRIDLENEHGE